MRKPKVLMVISRFYPFEGGAEHQARILASSLARHNVDLFILTGRWFDTPYFEYIDGVPVYRHFCLRVNIARIKGMARIAKLLYIITLAYSLIKFNKRYDVIHVHQALYPAFICYLISKSFKKKMIIKIGCGGDWGDIKMIRKNKVFGKLMLGRILRCDFIISISSQIKNELICCGVNNKKIFEIPNGVDIGNFNPNGAIDQNRLIRIKEEFGLSDKKIVVCISRVSRQKGLDILMKAWGMLRERDSDAALLIIGRTTDAAGIDYEKELVGLLEKLNIKKSVLFLGWVDNPIDFLSIADVFVMPSRSEGLSNALLEAMAMGLPCLASDIGGNSDIIDNDINGKLFKADDSCQLLQQLQILLDSYELRRRLGDAGAKKVRLKFSLESVTLRYIELYHNLS